MDFEAAIFDLDGTLLDSMDVWEHIDIQFCKKKYPCSRRLCNRNLRSEF